MRHEFLAIDNGSDTVRLDRDRVVARFEPPETLSHAMIRDRIRAIVNGADGTMSFPLSSVILPGDSVAIPVYGNFADTAALVSDLIAEFGATGIPQAMFEVICRADETEAYRELLPESTLVVGHDPVAEESSAYLANSRRGSRIYLNREMLDCDVILPVIVPEPTGIESVSGFLRGFWPEFSRAETRAELEEDFGTDRRAVRREIREVPWLAGVQAVVIGLPASHGLAEVAAVPVSKVQAWAHRRLNDLWEFEFDPSADSVLLIADEPEGTNDRRSASLFALAGKLAVRYRRVVVWNRFDEKVLTEMQREMEPGPAVPGRWLAKAKKVGRSAKAGFLGNLPEAFADESEIVLLEESDDLERQVNRDGRWVVVSSAWGVRAVFPD